MGKDRIQGISKIPLFHTVAPAVSNKVTIQYLPSQNVQCDFAFQKLKITASNRRARNTRSFSKGRGFGCPLPLLVSSFRKCDFNYQPFLLSMTQTLMFPAV